MPSKTFPFFHLFHPPSKPGQLILKRRDVYPSTRPINRENLHHRPAAVLTLANPRDSVTRGGLAARRRGRRDDVRGLDRIVLLLLLRQTGHVEEEHEADLRENSREGNASGAEAEDQKRKTIQRADNRNEQAVRVQRETQRPREKRDRQVDTRRER